MGLFTLFAGFRCRQFKCSSIGRGLTQYDFFDPVSRGDHVVSQSRPSSRTSQLTIASSTSEGSLSPSCHEDDAEIPFDWILEKVTGRSGATTDYILTEPARCPNCKHEVNEKTLVEVEMIRLGVAVHFRELIGIPVIRVIASPGVEQMRKTLDIKPEQ
jgi:hypothetical protein